MEINKYKANIYTDFTISSFHHPTTHNPLKSTATLAPSPTLPKPHYPSKNAITLASLVKGEVLSPEKIRATTDGIASPLSLAPHQPYQHRTIPCYALYSWLPCQRELDCDKATSYYKLQHFAILSTLIFAQPYLSQDWGIALHPHHQLDFPHYRPHFS